MTNRTIACPLALLAYFVPRCGSFKERQRKAKKNRFVVHNFTVMSDILGGKKSKRSDESEVNKI